jgi:prophage tail gpP-like protein
MNDIPSIAHTPAPSRLTTTMLAPGGKEIATLEVGGKRWTNWTSVRVEQKVSEAFPTFQFETSENVSIPLKVEGEQWQPGDGVRVYVGGVPAVFGYITERHVAYDSKQHAVRLIGVGDTFDLPTSSVPLDKLDGHDGKNWVQLAKDITSHLNIKISSKNADGKPFQKIGIQPGETIMMVLERYARMRNIVIGSMATGGLVGVGEHSSAPSGDLVEGFNILKANAVVRDTHIYKRIFAVGQNTGGSSGGGGAADNLQKVELPGSHSRNRHMVAVCEIADDLYGVARRCKMERVFTEGSEIEANITVQGWFKDQNRSDHVWKAGEYYFINSPSLVLNGVVLGCAACTYEQNDGGTTTTLNMVKPEHMNGLLNFRAEARTFEELRRAGQTDTGVPVIEGSPY